MMMMVLGERESFRTLSAGEQKLAPQLLVRLVLRQIQLVEAKTTRQKQKSAYLDSLFMCSDQVNTYQVCALGNRSVALVSAWMVNFCTPFMPSSCEKPCSGTLLVPVTN